MKQDKPLTYLSSSSNFLEIYRSYLWYEMIIICLSWAYGKLIMNTLEYNSECLVDYNVIICNQIGVEYGLSR